MRRLILVSLLTIFFLASIGVSPKDISDTPIEVVLHSKDIHLRYEALVQLSKHPKLYWQELDARLLASYEAKGNGPDSLEKLIYLAALLKSDGVSCSP